MRALALFVALVALAALGCYHDKYNVNNISKKEDYILPPDQTRYNEPDTAAFRAQPAAKQQDTLMGGGGKGGGGMGGGRGPGGGNGAGGF